MNLQAQRAALPLNTVILFATFLMISQIIKVDAAITPSSEKTALENIYYTMNGTLWTRKQ